MTRSSPGRAGERSIDFFFHCLLLPSHLLLVKCAALKRAALKSLMLGLSLGAQPAPPILHTDPARSLAATGDWPLFRAFCPLNPPIINKAEETRRRRRNRTGSRAPGLPLPHDPPRTGRRREFPEAANSTLGAAVSLTALHLDFRRPLPPPPRRRTGKTPGAPGAGRAAKSMPTGATIRRAAGGTAQRRERPPDSSSVPASDRSAGNPSPGRRPGASGPSHGHQPRGIPP